MSGHFDCFTDNVDWRGRRLEFWLEPPGGPHASPESLSATASVPPAPQGPWYFAGPWSFVSFPGSSVRVCILPFACCAAPCPVGSPCLRAFHSMDVLPLSPHLLLLNLCGLMPFLVLIHIQGDLKQSSVVHTANVINTMARWVGEVRGMGCRYWW